LNELKKSGLLPKLPSPGISKEGWPWTEQTDPGLYRELEAWPKISIVTPSYNQGTFIEETIRSVLLQNYPNLEYIIIDGGSNDETLDIIRKYEPWITHWVSEKDRGQAHAINKGLKKVTGAIFNWLNSDDYYAPNALFHVGSLYRPSHTGMMSFLQQNVLDGKVVARSSVFPSTDDLSNSLSTFRFPQPSCFFPLSALRQMGPLAEGLHYTMDWEWWVRYQMLFGLGKILNYREVVTNFRIHEASKTGGGNLSFIRDQVYVLNEMINQQMPGEKPLVLDYAIDYQWDLGPIMEVDLEWVKVLNTFLWQNFLKAKYLWKEEPTASFLKAMLEQIGFNKHQKRYFLKERIKRFIP
jgi:glycosyltransferase involved in cell wall biosynthesis